MKVLTIGTDRKLFEEGSAVQKRVAEYGAHMEELHIIVFATIGLKIPNNKLQIGENVWVYSSHSASRWLYIFDAIRIGTQIITDQKFVRGDAVVSAQDPFECGFVAWRVAKTFRLPFQLQIHTDFLSPYFKTSFLQRIRVMCARFLLPKATGVRVVSKRIADAIKKSRITLKNPVQILPIRITVPDVVVYKSETDLHKLFPHFKFIIFMASRLTQEKRIADALYALKKIVLDHQYVGLIIAGEGKEMNSLKLLSKKLSLSKHVSFLGFRNDIFELMKSANVFLLTSEYEGYGMSLIEAGLAHLPVITTDVGLSGEIITNGTNALVCPVGDISCFALSIIKLISNNGLRELLAHHLQSNVTGYMPDKETYIKNYVSGLESIKGKI